MNQPYLILLQYNSYTYVSGNTVENESQMICVSAAWVCLLNMTEKLHPWKPNNPLFLKQVWEPRRHHQNTICFLNTLFLSLIFHSCGIWSPHLVKQLVCDQFSLRNWRTVSETGHLTAFQPSQHIVYSIMDLWTMPFPGKGMRGNPDPLIRDKSSTHTYTNAFFVLTKVKFCHLAKFLPLNTLQSLVCL